MDLSSSLLSYKYYTAQQIGIPKSTLELLAESRGCSTRRKKAKESTTFADSKHSERNTQRKHKFNFSLFLSTVGSRAASRVQISDGCRFAERSESECKLRSSRRVCVLPALSLCPVRVQKQHATLDAARALSVGSELLRHRQHARDTQLACRPQTGQRVSTCGAPALGGRAKATGGVARPRLLRCLWSELRLARVGTLPSDC